MVNVGNPFTGQTLRLTGNGFAEGSSAVLMGVQRIDDVSRNYGIDVYNSSSTLDLTVPNGAPTGPIRVVTVGGTSAAFGIAFTAITASAANGTPQNTATASANTGQSITLNGSGLDVSTDVVFSTIDQSGTLSEQIVRPNAVGAGGTSIQVIVPLNAVSGRVRVVGAANDFPLQIVATITDVQVDYTLVKWLAALMGRALWRGTTPSTGWAT